MKSKLKLLVSLLILSQFFLWGCANDSIVTVFRSGDCQVNSYRIPSIVTAPDGSILVFCEARIESWKDKSRTDIVCKRSVDQGRTWSKMQFLTQGQTGAFMDPTPIVDTRSGRIMLFTSFWPAHNHTGIENRAFMISSDDNGKTWTEPIDVSDQLAGSKQVAIIGFGPGSGLQMTGDKFFNRLILPVRVLSLDDNQRFNVCAYSDDYAKSWTLSDAMDIDDEFQIAESPRNTLVFNARVPNARKYARSYDGGSHWEVSKRDSYLPGVSRGCQGSVLGNDSILYFSGIEGIPQTEKFDERALLKVYKSMDGGKHWNKHADVYDKASGYSCMTFMPDGSVGLVFENASTEGFTRLSVPNVKPLQRPAGWMNIVFRVLDK